MQMPFGSLGLKVVVHLQRTASAGTSHGELHAEDGQAEHQEEQDVDEHEESPSVLTDHVGELPDITKSYGTARAQQYESESAAKAFPLHGCVDG